MTNLLLFVAFFKMGLFGYGGGMGMLPLIFQTVRDFCLVSEKQISDLVGISQVTPGPIAVNAATFVGFSKAGLIGALTATAGVILPSFVLVLAAAAFMKKYQGSFILNGIMKGIRPVTVGLTAGTAVMVAGTVLFDCDLFSMEIITDFKNMVNVVPCIICAFTVLLVGKLKMSPALSVFLMGAAGAIICR